jgi:hypothetical protein
MVNDTGVASDGFALDATLPPQGSVTFHLGWEGIEHCGANHVMPVERLLVTLPGQRVPIAVPMTALPEAWRAYCWVDLIEMDR